MITPVGWAAIGVTTVAVVAYFAIPGVQEAVTTTTTQALDAASNGINALLAKKSDIAWMDWLSKKYGLLPDEREWLHQQMKKHGLTAEEIIEEIEEIIRLRDEEESEDD